MDICIAGCCNPSKAQKAATEEIEAKARANKQWKPSKGDSESSSDDDDDEEFRQVMENYLVRYPMQ